MSDLRLIYADPPYLGQCKRYGHRHEDPWGCWDDVETHAQLLESLREGADGWACSLSSTSLAQLLPLAGPCRIAAWVKPFAAFKRNVRIAYTWEPVLFVPGRDSSKDGGPVGRDHLRTEDDEWPVLIESIALQKGLTGAKPERFCRWVLDLMGAIHGDEIIDLFPGVGTMADVMTRLP